MADRSLIECTDATWNPVTGCEKVSSGCKHCYAERHWKRLTGNPRTVYYRRRFTDVQVHPDRLEQPLHWRKPRLVFVNSMSDLFHPAVSFEFIHALWHHMALAHHHVYQILTKRPDRAREFFRWNDALPAADRIQPICRHVWLGVSVETQALAQQRIPALLELPAAVRWVCAEPLLGPVDLTGFMGAGGVTAQAEGERCAACAAAGVPEPVAAGGIHWVVMGGENGPRPRPCRVEWLADLAAQCREAGVPVFVRQLGAAARRQVDGSSRLLPVEARRMGGRAHWPRPLQAMEYPL